MCPSKAKFASCKNEHKNVKPDYDSQMDLLESWRKTDNASNKEEKEKSIDYEDLEVFSNEVTVKKSTFTKININEEEFPSLKSTTSDSLSSSPLNFTVANPLATSSPTKLSESYASTLRLPLNAIKVKSKRSASEATGSSPPLKDNRRDS